MNKHTYSYTPNKTIKKPIKKYWGWILFYAVIAISAYWAYQGYQSIPQPTLTIQTEEVIIKSTEAPTVEDLIIASAPDYDSQLLIRLAFLESSLNPDAVGDGFYNSRGLYQISEHYHPQVSDECAFDPVCSTQWTVRQLKAGNGHWWTQYHLAL